MHSVSAVRIEGRTLYPQSGANTDLEAGTVRPWGPTDQHESPDEPGTVRSYIGLSRSPSGLDRRLDPHDRPHRRRRAGALRRRQGPDRRGRRARARCRRC